MDTCADALTVTFPWEPGFDPEIDAVTSPFGYQEAGCYIGGELQMTGYVYDVEHSRDTSGTTKDLEIYTATADLVDSTVLSPYEASNITLTERCKQQCEQIGIPVVIGDGVDVTVARRIVDRYTVPMTVNSLAELKGLKVTLRKTVVQVPKTRVRTVREELKFSRVSAEQTDTIFAHLSSLATQRGMILSCTKYGDLMITKPNVDGVPVGTIEESTATAGKFSARFSGRTRFALYRAIARSGRSNKPATSSSARDTVVTNPRVLTFQTPDNLPGEALSAAEWRKNKSAADALSIQLPVNTWYAPNGEVWTPNTTVTVISPTIGLKKGFTFLISQVEYDYTTTGTTAVLSLKPPTAYTTGVIEEPWL
jgi:prophage tail gpP-like protein